MVPSGSIPQAKHGRSRILYRKPEPRQGDRVEQKPKKKKRGLVQSLTLRPSVSYTGSRDPGRGIGWSKSQRRKSEVLCGRSRSGRPYLLRQAPCPKASHFPLALYPIAWEEGIQREKGKVVFGRSRSGRRIYLYRRPCQ